MAACWRCTDNKDFLNCCTDNQMSGEFVLGGCNKDKVLPVKITEVQPLTPAYHGTVSEYLSPEKTYVAAPYVIQSSAANCDTQGNIGIAEYESGSCKIKSCKPGYTFSFEPDRFNGDNWCFIDCPANSRLSSECPTSIEEKKKWLNDPSSFKNMLAKHCLVKDSGNMQQCWCEDNRVANETTKTCDK